MLVDVGCLIDKEGQAVGWRLKRAMSVIIDCDAMRVVGNLSIKRDGGGRKYPDLRNPTSGVKPTGQQSQFTLFRESRVDDR